MQSAALDIIKEHARHWTHGRVIARQFGAHRRLPLAGAADGDATAIAIIARVVLGVQLAPEMHTQLTRILSVTVRDWIGK